MWHAWERNLYRVLVGKSEGKRPLGRSRRRWEDGIRTDFREIGWGSVDWMQLAQDRDRLRAVVNTVMNLRVLAPRLVTYNIKPLIVFRRVSVSLDHHQ
jgi:hypothetical protein